MGFLVIALTGCGRFEFDGEAPVPLPTHVPESSPIAGTGDVALGSATIDTTALTIDGAPPQYGELVATPQVAGGPELAVFVADHVTIRAGGVVTVIGDRPLVIAARTIVVDGVLDAAAHGVVPGPGASMLRAGGGTHIDTTVCDSGGAGGGYGSPGGRGGDVAGCNPGPAGGAVAGDAGLTILVGGAAGGDAVSYACGSPPGGGGGGAIQLSAGVRVSVGASGEILAGGGGGSGGPECGDTDAGGGAGGGAGGAIYVEAPQITLDGLLVANGGGGGGAANGSTDNGAVGEGSPGADGTTREPARGGAPFVPAVGAGGDGAAEAHPAVDGGSTSSLNGGGGGGGVGRIVIAGGAIDGTGIVTPAPP